MTLQQTKIVLLLMLLLLSISTATALQQLLSLQGKVDYNGVLVKSGNLTVTIHDAATGGNLIYNSTRDFDLAIVDGYFDVMLGSARNLSLENNKVYYLDLAVNSTDLDWGSDERKQFLSPVGTNFTGDTNFTFDTNTLFIDSTNNYVGIGTTIPSTRLHINVTNSTGGRLGDMVDALRITNTSGQEYFFINGTTGNLGIGTTSPVDKLTISHATAPDIGFIASDTTATRASRIYGGFDGATYLDAFIKFQTHHTDSATLSDTMTLKAGNVGIGTTSPRAKLDINGNITLGNALVTDYGSFAKTMVAIGNGSLVNTYAFAVWQNTTGGDTLVALYARNSLYGGNVSILLYAPQIDGTLQGGQIAFKPDTSKGSMIITGGQAKGITIGGTGGVTTLDNLTGTGNDYVCVDGSGVLYRSDTACA